MRQLPAMHRAAESTPRGGSAPSRNSTDWPSRTRAMKAGRLPKAGPPLQLLFEAVYWFSNLYFLSLECKLCRLSPGDFAAIVRLRPARASASAIRWRSIASVEDLTSLSRVTSGDLSRSAVTENASSDSRLRDATSRITRPK